MPGVPASSILRNYEQACLMMGVWFWEILLKEAEERISTTRKVFYLARSCYRFCSCRFRRVVCRELCSEVGGDGWGEGRGWLSVRLYDSDMCIFGLTSTGNKFFCG